MQAAFFFSMLTLVFKHEAQRMLGFFLLFIVNILIMKFKLKYYVGP